LQALNDQHHEIDIYGIGTNLVTCQAQPALGMVYKLVELNGQPRIKLSDDKKKVSIPCKKMIYRLYNQNNHPVCDLMQRVDEEPPKVGSRVFCRDPFDSAQRCFVIPSKVSSKPKCDSYQQTSLVAQLM
jgi:nicotinate phosphoribosyltransferase